MLRTNIPTTLIRAFGLALVLLLGGVACGDSEPIPPGTIVIDDDHDSSTNENAEHYIIEARPTLRLDPRDYKVRARNKAADSIFVRGRADVRGRSEYHVAWDGVSPIEIGPENLKPINSTSRPFPGFETGVGYVIGAGAARPDGRGLNMDLMWAGLVNVRAPASR